MKEVANKMNIPFSPPDIGEEEISEDGSDGESEEIIVE